MNASFKSRDVVRLTEEARRLASPIPDGREDYLTAIITSVIASSNGVIVHRDMAGSKYWNVRDLEKVV